MEIIIHRGSHRIGGCITEYRTSTTRIIVDCGAELCSSAPFELEGVTTGDATCNAVFFTHYHSDHIGLINSINADIPLYMGKASKSVLKILNDRLSRTTNIDSYDSARVDGIRTFFPACPIMIGDIKITPFTVDHSAYDAYMFKLEADGKSVLHTGDFRTHGFRGKGVNAVLEKYIVKVDALVCEGTNLNRPENKCESESALKSRVAKVLRENKYVFVVCSSTNIDRLAGICSVVPNGRYCICDRYQMSLIEYIRSCAEKKSPLYKFNKTLYYSENLDGKMLERGFCMFVRCGNPEHKRIMEKYRHLNPVIIYSMWNGYLGQDSVKSFLSGFKRINMHTSGHADSDALRTVIETVKPDIVIPMHTEVPEAFFRLVDTGKLKLARDDEIISLGVTKDEQK